MTEPQLPGFDAVELLGFGSGGEVWLARDRATGTPVALKRLRPGADLAARDRLRREAAVLAGVDHPHVVRLRSVVADGDAMVLVLDLASGGSLARLLATRRRLAPGEVVTLAVPLAQALAAVHAQGLVHGDVTPANVLFAADGRPLLSDLGVSSLLGGPGGPAHGTSGFLDPALLAGGTPVPASDVHGLAATCLAALTGTAPYDGAGHRLPVPEGHPAALLAVLESALVPDPRDRPTAEALAVAVYDTARPEPVRLDEAGARLPSPGPATGRAVAAATHRVQPAAVADPVPPPGAPRRRTAAALARLALAARSRGRAALVVGAVGTSVVLAAVTGIAWAGAGGPAGATGLPTGDRPTGTATGPGPATTPAVPAPGTGRVTPGTAAAAAGAEDAGGRWTDTLARLDRARSRAFATGEVTLLRRVYAAGSPALARDRRVLARLTRAGLRAEGLRLTVTGVGAPRRSGGRVRLAVTDTMPPYRLVDAGGAVAERRQGRGPRSWTVVLARAGGAWRVYDVARG